MKPLLITDCDEVLLHMVRHFRTWLDEAHDVHFRLDTHDFGKALSHRATGASPTPEETWGFIQGFFPEQMHRQTLVPHAAEALASLAEQADIVVLTNLVDQCRGPRMEQLAAFGIEHRVETNQGGKGRPVARIREEHGNPVTVFVDDLAYQHASVAEHAPEVFRLQMISEPELAPHVEKSPDAHARIDDWREAAVWIAERFAEGRNAAEPAA
ncbi:HAD family hydrolase [Sphingomonas aracearum]|nr:HAD family hydrolase [Sphingomonas aracearum]